MAIIKPIIEQHFEEAASLWFLRDKAVDAPHYSLADLADLDERIEAHLDGLLISGDIGWEISMEALGREENGEDGGVFPAAVLAFASGDETRIQAVLKAGSTSPELSRGIVSALGWCPYAQVEAQISKLLSADPPALRRLGLAACVVHRQNPGQPLIDALSDGDPLLKARSLRAVGQLRRADLLPILRNNLSAEDEMCRFSAAWSAALLGDAGAVVILKALIGPLAKKAEVSGLDLVHNTLHQKVNHKGGCHVPSQDLTPLPLKVALRRMELSTAHAWQKELAQDPDSLRLSVIGAGVIGDPGLIPWLIEQMATPGLARVAGESFTMITGVDIIYEKLEGEWPEGFEAGPTENPEDDNVEMDPDEDLPWPNPELVTAWWDKNNKAFKNGTRYLLGNPISSENLQQVLRNGLQRQRAAATLELAMMQPGQPLFEVRAPGFRQKKLLGWK